MWLVQRLFGGAARPAREQREEGPPARASVAAAASDRRTIVPEEGLPVSFFSRRLPPWVHARIFAIGPGEERAYRASEWRKALVVVERGQIDLVSADDTRWTFARGDTLFLAGLPIRALRNEGTEVALLCALARAADFAPDGSEPRGASRVNDRREWTG